MADENDTLPRDEDSAGWQEFFEKYTTRLFGFFSRKGASPQDAHTLVERSWNRICEATDQIGHDRPVAPPIFAIAVRVWTEWTTTDRPRHHDDEHDDDSTLSA